MRLADLTAAEWLNRPQTQAIFSALDGFERRTRAVGGVVRDTILDRPRANPDIDLATELTPDEVIARARAAGIAVYPTGIDHGTVTLKLGDTIAEVTTLRRDAETDGRHARVVFGTDWVEDAKRRDFTMNALYCAADGTLFDPLGGLADALAKRVRFIGDPDQRIAEDGLRVYRFFRFSASHGGEVFDADGLAACARAAGALAHLSAERIGAEMLRLLALPKVAATLRQMTLSQLLDLDETALAALARYERLGGQAVASRLALFGAPDKLQLQWRLSNELVTTPKKLDYASDLISSGQIGEAAYRHGELAVEALAVTASREDWGQARLAETARELAAIVVPDFPITGHDLAGLGITPGPALGLELKRLERAWIDSGFALGKSDLMTLAKA